MELLLLSIRCQPQHVGDTARHLVLPVGYVEDLRGCVKADAIDHSQHFPSIGRIQTLAGLVQSQQLRSLHQGPDNNHQPPLPVGEPAEYLIAQTGDTEGISKPSPKKSR